MFSLITRVRHPRRWAPAVAVLLACATPPSTEPTASIALPPPPPKPAQTEASTEALAAEVPPCPAPKHEAGYPPWHRGYARDLCIRGPEGRWTVEKDDTDTDGWRHVLIFEGRHGAGFRAPVIAPTGLARAPAGAVVVLDLKNGASLISQGGSVVWTTTHPKCGAVDHVAVGVDGAIAFACGYSLVRIEAGGKVAWQKWPFGDHHVRGPWVDRDGVLYVSGDGKVAAIGPDGEIRWQTSTGFNRAVGPVVWNRAGHMVFDTSMADLHSDGGPYGGVRIYYEHEPNELFEVDRDGAVVRREQYTGTPARGWPEVLPIPEDGAHQAP